MQEHVHPQRIPVKMYRTDDRLSVAVPMPGLHPENITVEITMDGQLILDGQLRGALKGIKDVLLDEWSVGNYYRALELPVSIDGTRANVTYDNGVLVIVLPISEQMRAAHVTLEPVGRTRGERVSHTGRVLEPVTIEEHRAAKVDMQQTHGDGADPHAWDWQI